MRAGVDGQKASRSGGFGTEYADGVLVVDQVVDNQSVGIVPFHQWIDKSCVAVVADGIGDKLADGYGKSAIGPVSSWFFDVFQVQNYIFFLKWQNRRGKSLVMAIA